MIIYVRLNLNSFKLGKLKIRSVDWVLETARGCFDCLENISSISQGFGDDIGSVPFWLKLGRMEFGELSKVAVNFVSNLEGRADLIFDLQYLAL